MEMEHSTNRQNLCFAQVPHTASGVNIFLDDAADFFSTIGRVHNHATLKQGILALFGVFLKYGTSVDELSGGH